MKRPMLLLAVVCCLILPEVSADEKSEAEAAISEAEAMLDTLGSWGSWIGPALAMKTKAETSLSMAKESFEAGEYTKALEYAEMALQYAKRAKGMRAWLLLPGPGYVVGSTARILL